MIHNKQPDNTFLSADTKRQIKSEWLQKQSRHFTIRVNKQDWGELDNNNLID